MAIYFAYCRISIVGSQFSKKVQAEMADRFSFDLRQIKKILFFSVPRYVNVATVEMVQYLLYLIMIRFSEFRFLSRSYQSV